MPSELAIDRTSGNRLAVLYGANAWRVHGKAQKWCGKKQVQNLGMNTPLDYHDDYCLEEMRGFPRSSAFTPEHRLVTAVRRECVNALAKVLVMQRLQRLRLSLCLSATEVAAAANEPFCGACRCVGSFSWDTSQACDGGFPHTNLLRTV